MLRKPLRYKKLNTKTTLPVLREDEIDPNEYESLTTEQIATGVDAAEADVSDSLTSFYLFTYFWLIV
jgi:hypothetical protein